MSEELLRVDFHRDAMRLNPNEDPLSFVINEVQAILERGDRPPEIAMYLSTASKITVTITTE